VKFQITTTYAIYFSLAFSSLYGKSSEANEDNRYKFVNDEILFLTIPNTQEGEYIRYGYKLLSQTAEIMGPESSWNPRTKNTKSHMSCRNCHLAIGTKEFGNSFLNTHQLYPQYRAREGKIQTLAQRINACFIHPMQGKALDENSREMHAIQLYIKWIGAKQAPIEIDPDLRLPKIDFIPIAAAPSRGKLVFEKNCTQCHGKEGEGQLSENKKSFKYPPLWGIQSFITGSSMSRISILARFIYGNMPYMSNVKLSIQEAWDTAAFIESKPRPAWNDKHSPFSNLTEKAFDYPIGPYADSFPISQHKYGPFQPIIKFWNLKQNNNLGPSGI
jgi:thiosulfate dehydrogenase